MTEERNEQTRLLDFLEVVKEKSAPSPQTENTTTAYLQKSAISTDDIMLSSNTAPEMGAGSRHKTRIYSSHRWRWSASYQGTQPLSTPRSCSRFKGGITATFRWARNVKILTNKNRISVIVKKPRGRATTRQEQLALACAQEELARFAEEYHITMIEPLGKVVYSEHAVVDAATDEVERPFVLEHERALKEACGTHINRSSHFDQIENTGALARDITVGHEALIKAGLNGLGSTPEERVLGFRKVMSKGAIIAQAAEITIEQRELMQEWGRVFDAQARASAELKDYMAMQARASQETAGALTAIKEAILTWKH